MHIVKKSAAMLMLMLVLSDGYATEPDLNTIAVECGTDKGECSHNYIPIYEHYFSPLRNKSIKVLEIGFLLGSSARTWDKYFSNASLYFIDILPAAFANYSHGLSSRCHFYVADQEKREDLMRFIETCGGDFDVIVDDGGHTMKQQINSFMTLFPHVKSGGLYIIEDLHTSYWATFGGSGELGSPKTNPQSTISFLKALIDDVNCIGATTGHANHQLCPDDIFKKLTYYQQHIKSLHFYDSLCVIIKA